MEAKPTIKTEPLNTTEAKPAKTEKESDLEKYWKPVKENPGDFTGWTYLLQYVEQEVTVYSFCKYIHVQWKT